MDYHAMKQRCDNLAAKRKVVYIDRIPGPEISKAPELVKPDMSNMHGNMPKYPIEIPWWKLPPERRI